MRQLLVKRLKRCARLSLELNNFKWIHRKSGLLFYFSFKYRAKIKNFNQKKCVELTTTDKVTQLVLIEIIIKKLMK